MSFEVFYLARARARARAPGPSPRAGGLPSGPFPKRGERKEYLGAFCVPKNYVFLKVKVVEFRLQFRGRPSFRRPIREIMLPSKCHFYEKKYVFLKVKAIEFRLQFRHPPSFGRPIRSNVLPYLLYGYEKKYVFFKVIKRRGNVNPPYGRAERRPRVLSGKTANEIQISYAFTCQISQGTLLKIMIVDIKKISK